jgi:hypothetical protein
MRRDNPKSLNNFYSAYYKSLSSISYINYPISKKGRRKAEFHLENIASKYRIASNIDTWDDYNYLTLDNKRPLIHFCENEYRGTHIMEIRYYPEDLTLGLGEDP